MSGPSKINNHLQDDFDDDHDYKTNHLRTFETEDTWLYRGEKAFVDHLRKVAYDAFTDEWLIPQLETGTAKIYAKVYDHDPSGSWSLYATFIMT